MDEARVVNRLDGLRTKGLAKLGPEALDLREVGNVRMSKAGLLGPNEGDRGYLGRMGLCKVESIRLDRVDGEAVVPRDAGRLGRERVEVLRREGDLLVGREPVDGLDRGRRVLLGGAQTRGEHGLTGVRGWRVVSRLRVVGDLRFGHSWSRLSVLTDDRILTARVRQGWCISVECGTSGLPRMPGMCREGEMTGDL